MVVQVVVRFGIRVLIASLLFATCCVASESDSLAAGSGEAQWIWVADDDGNPVTSPVCYFRKTFSMGGAERGEIKITCDDKYELFVNGRRVGRGSDWKRLDRYDIRRYLREGRNIIAVKCENETSTPAGLVAQVTVMNSGNTDVSHSTDGSWLVSTSDAPHWRDVDFNESKWQPALVLGELGRTSPWDDRVQVADGASSGRFKLPADFQVERLIGPDDSGSIVAMTFNERGDIIASRERGPLVRIFDEDRDGVVETVELFCEEMENCQGILALNGDIFAVGDGPDGTGMYRLSDEDGDHKAEKLTKLLSFTGGMGEHGPHAPVLGPDGLIYLVMGNHTFVEADIAETSPHHDYYEGDLVRPRYEDAGGHAAGVEVPGGTVIRTDIDASFVELYAGGFRNAYDIAFNRQGDLFTFDSDMEWDEGLPWYRPTRIIHTVPGAEFGWRSGWAKWPDYYIDSLPAVVNTGRGSPTGVEFYNHHKFPLRYHNALFAADWSMGRILVVRLKESGGTYRGSSEVFLEGRPLNVTDLAVGPDGWMYFSTGGRDTEGGIYRVVWDGKSPPRNQPDGIAQAILEPQLNSAVGRNNIAKVKQALGEEWSPKLAEVADNTANPVDTRTRALDIMQLVGPPPSTRFLVKLSRDEDPHVRAKATYLMGIHFDEQTHPRLIELLDDADSTVRRKACESIVRSGQEAPVGKLLELLKDPYRFVRWAARRTIQQIPRERWQARVLAHDDARVFLEGATALLVLGPDRPVVDSILDRASRTLKGDVSDADFIDLVRIVQLALLRGEVAGDEIPEFREQLANEYPAFEKRMNRELVRLLVYLQDTSFLPRAIDELNGDSPIQERLHLAAHLRHLENGWTPQWQLALLQFYEQARRVEGGHSYGRYLDNFTKDFFATLPADLHGEILALGETLPSAAILVLPNLPEKLEESSVTGLVELARRLQRSGTEAADRLSLGVIAVLGRSGHPAAMEYLRESFATQPERRMLLAMGLAQVPDGENWPVLVSSFSVLEGPAAVEVVVKLKEVDRAPENPEAIRQAILLALRAGEDGAPHVIALLEKWTGQQQGSPEDTWEASLEAWQQWFATNNPNLQPATLPKPPEGSRWTEGVLLDFLASNEGHAGESRRGALVFEKAQCIKCHRCGGKGEGIGPDLSNVMRRFQTKEVVQSVLYPSQVISDQYASKTIITDDGRSFTGIVGAAGSDSVVVLQSNGEKVTLEKDTIDEVAPSSMSAMPDKLFENLSLDEIADLFAFLRADGAPQRSAKR